MISPQDQEWTTQFVGQHLDFYGRQKSAIIMSESIFAKLSFEKVRNDINEGEEQKLTNSNMFTSVDEGREWLLSLE